MPRIHARRRHSSEAGRCLDLRNPNGKRSPLSIRHTLLGLLDWAPMHGYALRELARSYQFAYPMPTNNIYPALKQLSTEGFVSVHDTEVIDGRARKIYEITPAGRAELERWLAEDPGEGPITVRDPNMLKIALLRDGALAGARAWIVAHRARVLEDTKKGEAFLREQGSSLPRFTRLVAEHGVEGGYGRVAFLDRLLDEIDADSKAS